MSNPNNRQSAHLHLPVLMSQVLAAWKERPKKNKISGCTQYPVTKNIAPHAEASTV